MNGKNYKGDHIPVKDKKKKKYLDLEEQVQ